jgi:hypothetical protein
VAEYGREILDAKLRLGKTDPSSLAPPHAPSTITFPKLREAVDEREPTEGALAIFVATHLVAIGFTGGCEPAYSGRSPL